MNVALTIVSCIAAIISALSAWRSNKAEKGSNKISLAMQLIEQDRRHAELIPDFHIEKVSGGSYDQVLIVKLDGPSDIGRIDKVEISIRDSKRFPASPSGTLTQEQIDNIIWGPYQFIRGLDGVSESGRKYIHNEEIMIGDTIQIPLEKTPPGRWTDESFWASSIRTLPFKMIFKFSKDDREPWEIPRSIDS